MSEITKAGIALLTFFVLVLFSVFYFTEWKPAEVTAKLYNQRFKTNYTTSDFFFAGEAIKKFLEKDIPERPKENIINARIKLEKE